ncbi:MAG: hypothetical protein FJ272_11920, partial [Planctomycetes bacterium]|nr:hypothetical protein [Planctomycetota bacterium]
IRKVKPGLPVSANTNHWPFGNKDWDTAIPLWRITEFGSSEHAHSGKPELEWLMPGFKSRLSHDTNPEHADIWRPAFPMFRSSGTPADIARHEHDMLIFMLSALSHGVVPWHGGQSSPFESEVRVHHAIAKRERFLSRNEVKHVAVWVSQDTHDFYGHIPGSSNLVDYRDTVLGNWLVLSRAHMPFQFVFDNMVTAGFLRDYKVLLAPNVAAMSAAAAEEVRRWVKAGGQLIFTAETSAYDEWGNKLAKPRLADADGHYLPRDPGLAYVRDRDQKAVSGLLDAIRRISPPLEVHAPPYVLANTFHSLDGKQLWVHLLNVSDYMPNDDTGFRGLESKPQFAGDGATDARVEFSDKPAQRVHRIAQSIVLTPRAWKVKSASLGVAGTVLPLAPDGSVTVPELDVHDVLVLALE